MTRTDIINILIKKHDYKSFLEIGVDTGHNQRAVQCNTRVGVDPDPLVMGIPLTSHLMTSDEFFEQNTETFDIIFVDGLHEAEQVYRDIINGLKVLNKGGTIVCHDMSPIEEVHQIVPRESRIWNGDCWKAWVQLRSECTDLDMFVINTDWGCGVIRTGEQEPIYPAVTIDNVNYSDLVLNRKKWLNLIEVDEFLLNL